MAAANSKRTHSRWSRAPRFVLFAMALLALLALAGTSRAGPGDPAPLPTIATDKADYAPGETVTLSGANWGTGEAVHVVVNDDGGQTWRYENDVTAGDDGTFSVQFALPDWFVAMYTATASGASGTATTTFTDANVQVTSPSPARFPSTGQQSILAGQPHDFSATVNRTGASADPNPIITGVATQPGSPGCPGTSVQTFPASWVSVVGQPVSVSGSTPVTLRVTVPSGQAAGDYQGRFRFTVPNGNATTNLDFCVKVMSDATAPSTTATPSPAANAAGWNNTDVSVALNASDDAGGSGVKEITYSASGAQTIASTTVSGSSVSDISITAEGTTTLSFFAEDNAGNVEPTKTLVVKIDKTAPSVSCGSADGVWHGTNVDITCTASDDGSGLFDPADAGFNLSTSVPAGSEDDNASTGTRAVRDKADNESTAGPVAGNKVDRKAPQLSGCDSPDGVWHADNVTLTCTYTDGGSGPAPQDVELTTDVAAGVETDNAVASAGGAQACDAVGNCATSPDDIAGNKVDRKAPTHSCEPAPSGWSATDVTRACEAADGGSGLAQAGDASFSLSTNVPAGQETANAQTGTKTLSDAVGNTDVAGPLGGNKVDKKGPVVTLVCPAVPVIKGSSASASWSATDGGSGVAAPASGSLALDTSNVGTQSASAPAGTAVDNVGNTSPSSAPCSYAVVYDWRGFFQPIDNNPDQSGSVALATVWNSAKAGQAIPVKFSLRGDQGLSIFAAGYPVSVRVACPSALPVLDVIETYASSTSGLHYDSAVDQYVYAWKTATTLANTCQRLEVRLVDDTSHYAFFRFIK